MRFLVIASTFHLAASWLQARTKIEKVVLSTRILTDSAGNTYEVCNLPQQIYGKTFDAVFTSPDYQSMETIGKMLLKR
jgi:hypothetical protein